MILVRRVFERDFLNEFSRFVFLKKLKKRSFDIDLRVEIIIEIKIRIFTSIINRVFYKIIGGKKKEKEKRKGKKERNKRDRGKVMGGMTMVDGKIIKINRANAVKRARYKVHDVNEEKRE